MSLIETISNSTNTKPPRKKGGRPRKEFSELKTHGITIWFTEKEYSRLEHLTNGTNLKVRGLIRLTINNDKIIRVAQNQKLKNEELIFCKELIKVAANINQAVKALNGYRYNPIEVESLKSIYSRLMNCIKILQDDN